MSDRVSAEHKAASIARLEETLKLKDLADNEARLRANADKASKVRTPIPSLSHTMHTYTQYHISRALCVTVTPTHHLVQEYQTQIAATDKKIAEGEAEMRGLHAKLAHATQERMKLDKVAHSLLGFVVVFSAALRMLISLCRSLPQPRKRPKRSVQRGRRRRRRRRSCVSC